jgi:hypothetical protein
METWEFSSKADNNIKDEKKWNNQESLQQGQNR